MMRTSKEEKSRVFFEFHDPNRMIRQIAQARKRSEPEDYCSKAIQVSSARTVDEHMNVIRSVLKRFGKHPAAK